MRKVRSIIAGGAAGLLAVTTAALMPPSEAGAVPGAAVAPSCSAFDDPIYQAVKPANGASLLTPWKTEATGAAKYGFTHDNGALFKASTTPQPGLVPVNRLYRGGVLQDFLSSNQSAEVESAGQVPPYADQGVSFYASQAEADCLVPILRLRKGSKHRLVVSASKAALVAAGWTYESVAFFAAPAGTAVPTPTPAPGGAFKFAVIPDTQTEATKAGDPRMKNRTDWLVKQGVKFATQTGDMVNWDTPAHEQYVVAKTAMNQLSAAGIPYTSAIGNHDTQATTVGGGARDATKSRQLERDTTTFNRFFKASDFGSIGGSYENGKVDNVYGTYAAGGLKWMVLSLEFCPRPDVVAWAKTVVAAHPNYNVIISTHSYLTASGNLDTSNQGYGDLSGKQVYDQLVSQYPNIKMVFTSHVGSLAKARVDTGVAGNKIYSFLTHMHSTKDNPVRVVDVDPTAGTLKTSIYSPATGYTWSAYGETLRGIEFVR